MQTDQGLSSLLIGFLNSYTKLKGKTLIKLCQPGSVLIAHVFFLERVIYFMEE